MMKTDELSQKILRLGLNPSYNAFDIGFQYKVFHNLHDLSSKVQKQNKAFQNVPLVPQTIPAGGDSSSGPRTSMGHKHTTGILFHQKSTIPKITGTKLLQALLHKSYAGTQQIQSHR